MKIIGKVVADNGYKLEIIRPIKDACLSIGTRVEVEISSEQIDLVHLYDNILDEETKNLLFSKFKAAQEDKKVTTELDSTRRDKKK